MIDITHFTFEMNCFIESRISLPNSLLLIIFHCHLDPKPTLVGLHHANQFKYLFKQKNLGLRF